MSHPLKARLADSAINPDGPEALARIGRLQSVARDAYYALTAIIYDQFDEYRFGPTEDQCNAEVLCGHRLCDVSGCLKNKRDTVRSALNEGG